MLLGLGLSASTGLNTFLPLLLLSAAARFHIAGIELGQRFDWLSSDVAIIVLIVASVVEIVADKVPAVDHFLDSIGTFIRPLAATVATASVLTGADVNPTVAAVVGLMIGAPTSLGFHTLKAGTRVASSAATLRLRQSRPLPHRGRDLVLAHRCGHLRPAGRAGRAGVAGLAVVARGEKDQGQSAEGRGQKSPSPGFASALCPLRSTSRACSAP